MISLKIKQLQKGIFAVKRFNKYPVVVCACVHTCARAYGATGLLKRFIFVSWHPGGIFVLRGMQEAKIKRFNRLCQNTAHLQPETLFSI